MLTRDHTVLPTTDMFIHELDKPSAICLYFPATDYHRTLAGTHFPSHWGYGHPSQY